MPALLLRRLLLPSLSSSGGGERLLVLRLVVRRAAIDRVNLDCLLVVVLVRCTEGGGKRESGKEAPKKWPRVVAVSGDDKLPAPSYTFICFLSWGLLTPRPIPPTQDRQKHEDGRGVAVFGGGGARYVL